MGTPLLFLLLCNSSPHSTSLLFAFHSVWISCKPADLHSKLREAPFFGKVPVYVDIAQIAFAPLPPLCHLLLLHKCVKKRNSVINHHWRQLMFDPHLYCRVPIYSFKLSHTKREEQNTCTDEGIHKCCLSYQPLLPTSERIQLFNLWFVQFMYWINWPPSYSPFDETFLHTFLRES